MLTKWASFAPRKGVGRRKQSVTYKKAPRRKVMFPISEFAVTVSKRLVDPTAASSLVVECRVLSQHKEGERKKIPLF